MSTAGHQAGGIVGFLTSLKNITELLHPQSIFVVWEGGGSSRRRALVTDYKRGRRASKLNRYYEDIPDSDNNRMHQVAFLTEVLKTLPVCQLYVEDLEADDVIGFLSRNRFRDKEKVIASTDSDFFQLLDDKTTQYSWSKRGLVTSADVVSTLGMLPSNYALAKSICGDPTDNIPGVKGVGYKTLAKRFPELGKQELSLKDIIQLSEQRKETRVRAFKDIYTSSDLIARNLRVIHLDSSNLAAVQVRKIEATIDSFKPSRNKMQLMRQLINEGLETYDAHNLFSAFLLV